MPERLTFTHVYGPPCGVPPGPGDRPYRGVRCNKCGWFYKSRGLLSILGWRSEREDAEEACFRHALLGCRVIEFVEEKE